MGFPGCGKIQSKGLSIKGTADKISRMSRASALAIHSLPKFAFRLEFIRSLFRRSFFPDAE
jgi:hypothetical protein